MSKINNKSINFGLKALTLLAFILIFIPLNSAMAQESLVGYGENYGNGNGNYNNGYYNNSYYNSAPYQPAVYVAPAPTTTPIVYSNTNNPNPVMTVNYIPSTAKPKTVATATKKTDSASNLAANAIYGSNSFLPSGIIQWILFAMFVLILIILVRRIFGAKEDYHATPLKHE